VRAPGRTRIAVLRRGYHDGVPWRLWNGCEVLVRGARAPIVGRVSMDYVTVDVGHIRGVNVGDAVTLIGQDAGQSIDVEEIARHADTIAYEITCAVGRRVRRTYVGGAELEVPTQARPAEVAWSRAAATARDDAARHEIHALSMPAAEPAEHPSDERSPGRFTAPSRP
jgi:hypothetical protein